MKTAIAAALVSVLSGSLMVSAQGPPKAGPEHKRLAYFAGTWNFSGTTKESPMGPAGPINFKEVCELLEGGFALVCRSEGKGPMGPSKSHSIMSYDAEKKAYTYTAAETNSPVFTALGQIAGDTWNWTSESKFEGKPFTMRVTIKEGGPASYEMTMEMSVDGKTFMPLMQGKSTKAGT
jgi:hypothetical protein